MDNNTRYLFGILQPLFKKQDEQRSADQEKFKELISILKPSTTKEWCADLRNASYHVSLINMQDEYSRFIRLPDSYFFRRKLNKKYKKFNESFINLEDFLAHNFFIYDVNFLKLYRELQSSDPAQYGVLLEELQSLVDIFEKEYNDLVCCGREKYIGTLISFLITSLLLLITIPTLFYLWGLITTL